MKKILAAVLTALLAISLTGCEEPEHTVSYVSWKQIEVADFDCVAVFTQYTNGSSDTAIPADEVSVKAFQNGVEIPPIVPTGERTDGYIQCDASVQAGVTADVVWIFELDDSSMVTVELSGGEKVELTQ